MFDQSADTAAVGASWHMPGLRALLLAATALSAVPAGAAEWINPGTGNWLAPGNWDGGSVPTSSGVSFVGNGGTSQVTGGGAAVSDIVAIGSETGNGTIAVGGAGSSLMIGSDLFLGDYSVGTLNVSAGGVVSTGNYAHVGYNLGSTGAATVSGAGSKLSTVFLELGYAGRGTIDVSNGGTLESQNSEVGYGPYGKVVVDGAGSSWSSGQLFVGVFGDGFVDITNGGAVTSSYAHLASRGYSKGTVLVDGIGSSWTLSSTLSIGHQGQGTLTISNGGVVSSGSTRIASFGSEARGIVTVDGKGSRWSIDGDLDIGLVSNGQVTISNGGSISADSVTVGRAGTLAIGALPEDEAVAAGSLVTGGIDLADGDARLVFNHTDADYTFDADITGGGMIEFSGPGKTRLTGNSRDFYGDVRLLDGELMVDEHSWLGGDMTSKARLSGEGVVRNVSVVGGGVIAPGKDRIGTLAMAGNLYMGPGSTYEVEIGSGSSDLIQVMGIAYVEGADILVKRSAGPLALGAGYIILSADGGFYGSFGDIVSDYAFITPQLVLIPDVSGSDLLTLEFNRNSVAFADVARPANQASAAAALDAATGAAHNTVLSLNEAEAQAMFDALSGEAHATLKGVLMDNTGLVSDALLQRLDAARALDASGAASGYAAPPTLPEAGGGNAIWGAFYGGLGRRGSDGNAAEAEQAGGGLLLGADAAVGDWQVGLAAQVGQTSVSIADRATEATAADLGAGFYAGTSWGDTGFSVAGTLTRHAISTRREVGGGLNETLTADYGATTGQVVAELEHGFDLGAASVIPYAQLGHTVEATEAFTEVGNGAGAALSGEADVVNQSFATLGLRGAYQFVVGQGGLATFSGGIGWRRGFGEAPTAHLGFNGGSPFVIAATPAAADSLLLEAGLAFDLAEGVDISASYAGSLAPDGQSHALRAGLGGQF